MQSFCLSRHLKPWSSRTWIREQWFMGSAVTYSADQLAVVCDHFMLFPSMWRLSTGRFHAQSCIIYEIICSVFQRDTVSCSGLALTGQTDVAEYFILSFLIYNNTSIWATVFVGPTVICVSEWKYSNVLYSSITPFFIGIKHVLKGVNFYYVFLNYLLVISEHSQQRKLELTGPFWKPFD